MFLYYVPRIGAAKWAIPDHLAYVTDGGIKLHRREVMGGPGGGGGGNVFACGEWDPADVSYLADKQTWVAMPPAADPEAPACWVGRYNDAPLDSGKLARATMLENHVVALADGSRWHAAVARGFDAQGVHFYTPLPKTLTYDPTSNRWRPAKVAKEYRRFMELAISYGDAHDAAVSTGTATFPFEHIDELAILSLTANYRIGPAELSLFEDVYTVSVRDALVGAALDFPTIKEWTEKKSDSAGDGSSTSPGNAQ
jgi:hypothetical protein